MTINSDSIARLTVPESGRPKQNVFRIPQYVRTTRGTDGATVLDILHGQMFRINFVGSRILELLKQGLAEPEIAEHLAREFEIERVVADADVHDFVETLEMHKLVSTSDLIPSPALE